MSNITQINASNTTTQSNITNVAFGRYLEQDTLNTITQIGNDTIVIKPRYNIINKTELKIGVLLPFSQKDDKLTEEIVWGGSSAIRMAVNYINEKEIIPGAYITLVQKDSFPNGEAADQGAVTTAVYASVTLIQQGVIAVIGDISSSWTALSALITSILEIPQCSFTANAIGFSDKSQYKYFYRTIPTKVTTANVMLDFIVSQGWKNAGVIYSNDLLGQQFYQKILNQADRNKVNIVGYQPFTADSEAAAEEMFKFVKESAMRIIIMGVTGSDQVKLIQYAAAKTDLLSSGQYVWLLMDDNSSALVDALDSAGQGSSLLNGIFLFDLKLSLRGYPPYEAFLDQWGSLNPKAYPYAGTRNASTNEGPAYSCVMTLARGFNRALASVHGNSSLGLEMLSNRTLGPFMTPLTFNTGYISPEGPMHYDANGDLTVGNHRLYNFQQGKKVSIGRSIGGNLELVSLPMFHDGSSQPPADLTPSRALNPTFKSAISQVIVGFSVTWMLFALFVLFLVVMYRKHNVFRSSSPLFCAFELIGFLLTYISVIFMVDIPTKASCFVIPITFNLGFILVLGNLIAKNYRIYRIFNNIFISRTVITDFMLMKSTLAVVSIDMLFLIIGLIVCQPVPKIVKITPNSHYWICESETSVVKTIFTSLAVIYAATMLLFATFLAYRTRSAGKHYDHLNENKQMGFSVYNILFSALVGFTAMLNPIASYTTKFYFAAIVTLWASTFSLCVLFVPKVYIFYVQWKLPAVNLNKKKRKLSSTLTIETTWSTAGVSSATITAPNIAPEEACSPTDQLTDDYTFFSFLKTSSISSRDLTDNTEKDEDNAAVTECTQNNYDSTNVYVEVQEGDVPVRRAFRYFPFLSQWKMRRLMIFPRLQYISYYSTESKQGTMISYSHASVYSSSPEEYVLKIHGKDVHDVYIQLGDFITMESWQACLNQDIMKQHQIDGFPLLRLGSNNDMERGNSLFSANTSYLTGEQVHCQQQAMTAADSQSYPTTPMTVTEERGDMVVDECAGKESSMHSGSDKKTIGLLSPPSSYHHGKNRKRCINNSRLIT